MRGKCRQLVAVVICALGVAVFSKVSEAYIFNTINFLGTDRLHDAESEYRLLELATDIVEARQISTHVSMSVKGAYRASLLGQNDANIHLISQATGVGNSLHEKWREISNGSIQLIDWLDEKLRPEYAEAFCEVAAQRLEFHQSLVNVGASDEYMSWAFSSIGGACHEYNTARGAVLSTFRVLGELAQQNATNAIAFLRTLNALPQNEAYVKAGIYGYIFDNLAIRAKKPELFVQDEVFFTGLSRFDIYYEALEQVSREAHTLIPGTHDQEFQTFDLNYTD